MSHRKKAICTGCQTTIEYFAFPHYGWFHVELELEHTAGHIATPGEKAEDRGPRLRSLTFARSN